MVALRSLLVIMPLITGAALPPARSVVYVCSGAPTKYPLLKWKWGLCSFCYSEHKKGNAV